MALRILHLVDSTTPSDAFDILARLVDAAPSQSLHQITHRIVAMGHRSSARLAALAGIPRESLSWIPSLGWADPAGWRAMRRLVAALAEAEPTHIHAWGIQAVVASAVTPGSAARIATFCEVPKASHLRLLRLIDGRSAAPDRGGWSWVATSTPVLRALRSAGVRAERSVLISPGVPLAPDNQSPPPAAVKEELGILADDGPILLLGGEGRHARHDYGLWASAILQQIFPRTRVIVREDPRGLPDPGFERFFDALPDERMIAIASPTIPWRTLASIADLLLVTPDGPCLTGSILTAMAAGVPVVGTPVDCVTELVAHGETGLLARAVKPREIASRLEEYMGDSTLRWPLADRARAELYARFSVTQMLEAYDDLYADGLAVPPPPVPPGATAPSPAAPVFP